MSLLNSPSPSKKMKGAMIDDMSLFLPPSTGKPKASYILPKPTPQKSTMFWHAHQAVGNGVKSSIVVEAVTVDALRRSLKTAN